MSDIFIKGFFLGASLIMAIGLQNAFVLRQGIKHSHILATASFVWFFGLVWKA